MVTVKKRKPATIQNTNKSVRDAMKLLKSRSSVLNPMRQFLAHCCSLDTFVIAKASTQKEDWAVVAQACFFASSFSVLRLAYEAWPSTGRGVAGASCIHKNKNRKNFFWRVWTLFRENFHQQKFPSIRYVVVVSLSTVHYSILTSELESVCTAAGLQ